MTLEEQRKLRRLTHWAGAIRQLGSRDVQDKAATLEWSVRKIERLTSLNRLLADHLRQTTKALQELEDRIDGTETHEGTTTHRTKRR